MVDDDTRRFGDGEKVFVPHVDKLYSARVVKAEFRDKEWHYLLHYLGWNKRWDEWVEESGMQAWDSELQKQQDALQDGGASFFPDGSQDADVELLHPPILEEVDIALDAQPPMHLPPSLKRVLQQDYQRIVNDEQPYKLPRTTTVEHIFNRYIANIKANSGNFESEEDTMNGLRLYFDTCLPNYLLYPLEREETEKLIAMGFVPSSLFGLEHLLRMLAKLPYLLKLSEAPQKQIQTVSNRTQDLIKWLIIHVSRLEAS